MGKVLDWKRRKLWMYEIGQHLKTSRNSKVLLGFAISTAVSLKTSQLSCDHYMIWTRREFHGNGTGNNRMHSTESRT